MHVVNLEKNGSNATPAAGTTRRWRRVYGRNSRVAAAAARAAWRSSRSRAVGSDRSAVSQRDASASASGPAVETGSYWRLPHARTGQSVNCTLMPSASVIVASGSYGYATIPVTSAKFRLGRISYIALNSSQLWSANSTLALISPRGMHPNGKH